MEPTAEISELMERIRASVRAEREADGPPVETAPRAVAPKVPGPLPVPPAPAGSPLDDRERAGLELALEEAASMLPRARRKTEVGAGVPKMLRSLYRNQGGFNGILLEASERLLEANRCLRRQNLQFQERLKSVEDTVSAQHDWMVAAARMHDQKRQWMNAVETQLVEVEGIQERIAKLQEKADGRIQHLADHLKNLQTEVHEQGKSHASLNDQHQQAATRHELLDQRAKYLEERQRDDARNLRYQILFLQRLVEPLRVPPTEKPPETVEDERPASGPIGHDLDALYLAFEDAMRGSRREIKERIRVYLPYITAANAGTVDHPVLDLGCGRGEWLELLGESGFEASGVDLNLCMIELCREQGLRVTSADVLDYLRRLPDASCGAITAFHLIEHLPTPVLIRFLQECHRVLQPGGVAIFETPNPYNVLVGSGYFYHDFTHQRPLPPTSTKFLVEQMGFSKVDVLPLNPWDESAKVHGDEAKALEWRFNELFYGPQDYALIATP